MLSLANLREGGNGSCRDGDSFESPVYTGTEEIPRAMQNTSAVEEFTRIAVCQLLTF